MINDHLIFSNRFEQPTYDDTISSLEYDNTNTSSGDNFLENIKKQKDYS